MKKLSLSLTLATSIFANELDLDNLLDDFARENDLSNDTKIENAGSTQLVVYTREDLDKLQYQTLKDILAVQRFFTYRENRYGMPDLIGTEPLPYGKAGQLFKVYIDGHELTSLEHDSMIHILGDMELDFIDHVEIYQGSPSFDVSRKASATTIKLYSKQAQRNSGHEIGTLTDNNGTSHSYFHTASNEEKINYFVYFSKSNYNREKIKNGSTDLSRDENRKHLFSTFNYNDHEMMIQYLSKEKDGFLTNSIDATPTKDDIYYKMLNVAYKKKFSKDKTAELKIAYTKLESEIDFEDDNARYAISPTNDGTSVQALLLNPFLDSGIKSFLRNLPSDALIIDILGEKSKSTDQVKSIELNKEYIYKKHKVFTGASFSHKTLSYDKDQYITSTGTVNLNNYLTNQKLFSAYAQDSYSIDDNNTISLGFKIEREQNSYFNDETLYTSRLSHIYEDDSFIFMTYASNIDINKTVTFYNTANKDLKNESTLFLGHETKYKYNDNLNINYNILNIVISDLASFNTDTYKIENSDEKYNILTNSIKFTYKYDDKNSFIIEPWREDIDAKIFDTKLYIQGVNTRMINTFGNFTILNEFLLLSTNNQDTTQKNEWQYNLGITYTYKKDFTLYIKGENIFDGRSGYEYSNYLESSKAIDTIEERYSVGIKYKF